MIRSHKELIVWQKSIDFVVLLYDFTKSFPSDERFGLVIQMRRAAISIPSNIAEGRSRGTRKDFQNFLRIAFASISELETQLLISSRLGFGSRNDLLCLKDKLAEIQKMLNAMIAKLAP